MKVLSDKISCYRDEAKVILYEECHVLYEGRGVLGEERRGLD
jgi:hypothetical protein